MASQYAIAGKLVARDVTEGENHGSGEDREVTLTYSYHHHGFGSGVQTLLRFHDCYYFIFAFPFLCHFLFPS